MMVHSMFLIVTGGLLMPSTHDPSHGAGQTRPVNSGKLLVRWSRSRRSEEHTSELQSRRDLVCRLLLEKKKGRRDGRGRVRCRATLAAARVVLGAGRARDGGGRPCQAGGAVVGRVGGRSVVCEGAGL